MVGAARVKLEGNDASLVGDFPTLRRVPDNVEVLIEAHQAGPDRLAIYLASKADSDWIQVDGFSLDGDFQSVSPLGGMGVGYGMERIGMSMGSMVIPPFGGTQAT